MNYRLATIFARENFDADKTEPITIDIVDPISRLIVTYEPDCQHIASTDADGHPAKCITKIELVDGSDVLYSLTGQQAQAVSFYNSGIIPPDRMTFLTGQYFFQTFNINFGRYLWDEILALDPKKFRNLKLNIAIDIDGGGDDTTNGYLTVLAQLFDEKAISPTGFLMSKEAKDYTLGDDSWEYTDLPADHVYKQLFLMAQRAQYAPDDQIAQVKLSEDADKRIPFDHTMSQILAARLQEWPMWEETITLPTSVELVNYFCTPGYRVFFADVAWRPATSNIAGNYYYGNGGRFSFIATATGPNRCARIFGYAPHSVVPLLPRSGNDMVNWYDVSKIANLKLHVQGGSSVGTSTAQIITQQLRAY